MASSCQSIPVKASAEDRAAESLWVYKTKKLRLEERRQCAR